MDIFQKLLQIEDETGGDVSNLRNLINSGQLTTASNIPQPDPKESVREIELFNRFNRDYPNYADGGRIGFRKKGFVNEGLKAASKKVNLDRRAKSILEYQDRFGKETLDNISQTKHGKNFSQLNTVQLNNLKRRVVKFEDFIKENNRMPTPDEARKFGRVDRDKTIMETGGKEITEQDVRNKLKKNNKYAETFKGKVIFADKSIQDQFESELTKRYLYPRTSAAAEKAGVLSNQQLYEKFLKPAYSQSSARTIIDDYKKSLDLTFKELSPEEKEAKKVEREKLEKISQGGRRVSGTVDNPAHHLFPLGDDIGAKAGEFTIIPKQINGQIAYANKQMKQLTEERRNLLNKVRIDQTVDIKNLDKQLANINARAEEVIKKHYKKYPSHEGLLNWKKIDFITDDVGRLLNVRQVGTIGGDYKKWTLDNIDKTILNKDVAKLNANELRNFRNVIKEVSSQRDLKPTKLVNPINKMQLENVGQRLAAIGCPGKAKGGRIEFNLGGSPECITRGLENLRTGNMSPGAKANARQLVKNPSALRNFTKFALGPLGIPTEIAIGGFFAATDYATGANKDEIISNLTFGGFGKSMDEQAQERNPLYQSAKNLDKTFSQYLAGLDKEGKPRRIPNPRGMGKKTTYEDVVKAMEPFQRVNPQLESGQMFDLDMFDKALATPQELQKEKTQRALDRGLYTPGDRSIDPFQAAKGGRAGYNNGKLVEPVEIDMIGYVEKSKEDMHKHYKYYKQMGGKMKKRQFANEFFRQYHSSGGVASGPPPEKGPNSQGLQGLLNRVKKLKE